LSAIDPSIFATKLAVGRVIEVGWVPFWARFSWYGSLHNQQKRVAGASLARIDNLERNLGDRIDNVNARIDNLERDLGDRIDNLQRD
jgi:hypothetical protein